MPKNLLLADDSITIQKVVGIIFKGEDYAVTPVDNGEDALSRVRELRPDIVLADAVMPRKNGYELCEAVKNDPDLRDTPVLLLAGTFEAFDEARARAAGADGWIQKPFESAALLNKVREIAEGIAAPAAPAQPWATATATPPAPSPAFAPPPPAASSPTSFSSPLPPFATPPRPPSPPFAARNAALPQPPLPPPPPPFAARPPHPPAPPPPPMPPAPTVRDVPTFAAPRPAQQPPVAPAPPSFSAPATPATAYPPPPPPAPSFEIAPLPPDLDAELGSDLQADAEPTLELTPPPAAPPVPPAIPTQRVAPAIDVSEELEFDIDEAAAPIDLEDLAAEEITEEEALLVEEPHPTSPLSVVDLFGEEARTPPPLEFAAPSVVEPEPEPAPEPLEQAAGPFETFEPFKPLEPFAEAPEPFFRSAEPEKTERIDPFARAPAPFHTGSEPELRVEAQPEAPPEVETEVDAEPAAELLAAVTAAPAGEAAPEADLSATADEALLRDVLSRASRDTIERVVWEVVPQLAEAIIREHLEQLMRDRKNS